MSVRNCVLPNLRCVHLERRQRNSEIRRTLLSAALALALSDMAYAATEIIDKQTAVPSPPLSRNDPGFETVTAPPDGAKTVVIEPFDSNGPPRATIPIGPDLRFGGFVSLAGESKRNYSLSSHLGKADSILTPTLAPAFAYDPNQYLQLYVNPLLTIPVAVEEIVDSSQATKLNMNLAFLTLKDVVPGTKLLVGRQRFIDSKRWLFDENMDAIRLGHQYENLSVEMSVSQLNLVQRNLLRREGPKDEETFVNYYLFADYKFGKKNHVGLFALYQDQQRLGTAQPIYVGLQSGGRILNDLKYWIQTAIVRGTDGARSIRGEAIDVGLTQRFGGSWEPSITVAYAYGTGDKNPDDNVDTSFRQTGFQGNSDKFNGVTRFKYYGEVLDPSLTNLMVFTGGVGIKPFDKTSFEVVYHYYLQDHASTSVRGTDISADPAGLSKHIGSEVDFVAGYLGIQNLRTRFILGYFVPGSAFHETTRDGAFLASILLRYDIH